MIKDKDYYIFKISESAKKFKRNSGNKIKFLEEQKQLCSECLELKTLTTIERIKVKQCLSMCNMLSTYLK